MQVIPIENTNEIEIDKIVIKDNVREDYGDLTELTASIKQHGIRHPIELSSENELIDGHRRLEASKAAGLTKVPFFYSRDDLDKPVSQMIAGIFQKNLNSVEEARAFKAYIGKEGKSAETVAKELNKPTLYVERRLELLSLCEEALSALSAGKILIGHALTLARIKSAKEQKKMLKEILREKLNVSDAEQRLQYENFSADLSRVSFDKSQCKGCKHNGGEQSMLFESGSEIKNLCLDAKCYQKKTREWKKQHTKDLKEQGIKVLTSSALKDMKTKEAVSEYDDDYKKVKKKLAKEPENYAVVMEDDYSGNPKEKIYCLNPKARRPKKKNSLTNGATSQNTADRLKAKVNEYRTQFLIDKTRELMPTGSVQSKAVTLFALILEGNSWNDRNKQEVTQEYCKKHKLADEEEFGTYDINFPKLLNLKDAELDRHINHLTGLWVKSLHDHLAIVAESVGVDLKQHFQITEEYLKPYTKDALIAVAKEIGLDKHLESKGMDKWEKSKRTELVASFFNTGFDLKGKVPKIMRGDED